MISIRRSIQSSLQNGALKRYYASPIPNLVQSVDDFKVKNEPVYEYKQGSQERKLLEDAIAKYSSSTVEIPLVVDGERFSTNLTQYQVAPFDHQKKLAKYYWATPEIIAKAIGVSQKRKQEWERVPLKERIRLFLAAADLVSGKYRYELNATTMLGQSKTIIQAEIDAAAELADFFRFNAFFAKELLNYQPISERPSEVLNLFRYRSLDGFVAAISPFNFTAIGGNLATAPTLMGNTVLWKPSDTALLSNYIIYQLLEEAGFPKGVISFLPCDGPVFGNVITKSSKLAGINFTGSVATFNHIWKEIANNLDLYQNYPRLVGECGGKNFHFVHSSANLETVISCTIRSAFEYSGQKCSACSRAYIPQSIWSQVKARLVEETKNLKLGSALDPKSFLSAVIDEKAFNRITSYIEHAKSSSNLEILVGGSYDKSKGYFVEPTIVLSTDPNDKIIREEIFGPLLSVYVYEDNKLEETLNLVRTSRYGLTGAIFGEDQKFLEYAADLLKHEAGNFYVNDKSTGSIVGQQPFGGSKMSGTNDKAGGPHYLLRWASPQNVKQTFVPQTQITYPYMQG